MPELEKIVRIQKLTDIFYVHGIEVVVNKK
jgi:hypothetical protein